MIRTSCLGSPIQPIQNSIPLGIGKRNLVQVIVKENGTGFRFVSALFKKGKNSMYVPNILPFSPVLQFSSLRLFSAQKTAAGNP
jgi:hypothetical protein